MNASYIVLRGRTERVKQSEWECQHWEQRQTKDSITEYINHTYESNKTATILKLKLLKQYVKR